MVGYFIQLFSFNLLLHNEFFIRLSSVLFGAVNTWLIYKIGEKIKSPLCGLYSALLFNCSIYCFVITGVFILPDTPLLLFWLLSIYLLFPVLTENIISKANRRRMLFAGITIGMAMLSKYHGVYLWIATYLYIILYNRDWLRTKELYISLLFSLLLFAPVIYWNYSNNLISFAFQGERANIFVSGLNPKSFITELSGEFLYNNPVNFIIIVFVLYKLFRSRFYVRASKKRFLLIFSLPLIFIFLFISLFRSTMPHWSAIGYTTLIILAGYYFSVGSKLILNKAMKASLAKILLGVFIGVIQVSYGIIPLRKMMLLLICTDGNS